MAKYVKVEDVVALINGLDSLPFEEETKYIVTRLPLYSTDKVTKQLERTFDLWGLDAGKKLMMRKIVRAGGENGSE